MVPFNCTAGRGHCLSFWLVGVLITNAVPVLFGGAVPVLFTWFRFMLLLVPPLHLYVAVLLAAYLPPQLTV